MFGLGCRGVLGVVDPVVLGEQVPAVVAVRRAHDGVHVKAGGFGVGEEDAGMAVVLDEQRR